MQTRTQIFKTAAQQAEPQPDDRPATNGSPASVDSGSRPDRRSRPTVVAVCNQKGGVAKTTTCLSLGACLAELGHSVLLIDLDPQAHLTMSLGIEADKLRRSGSDALLSNQSLVSISRESAVFGLDIVPSDQALALADKVLYQRRHYEYQLQRRLDGLTPGLYDFVLIDCAPAFGTLTLNALTAADLLLIPIQCEYYAAQSLRGIVKLARLVNAKTNPHLTYRLVVTMFNRQSRISRMVGTQLYRELGNRMLKAIVEVDPKLQESPAFQQPINRYAPDSRAARQYRAVAKEVAALVTTPASTYTEINLKT